MTLNSGVSCELWAAAMVIRSVWSYCSWSIFALFPAYACDTVSVLQQLAVMFKDRYLRIFAFAVLYASNSSLFPVQWKLCQLENYELKGSYSLQYGTCKKYLQQVSSLLSVHQKCDNADGLRLVQKARTSHNGWWIIFDTSATCEFCQHHRDSALCLRHFCRAWLPQQLMRPNTGFTYIAVIAEDCPILTDNCQTRPSSQYGVLQYQRWQLYLLALIMHLQRLHYFLTCQTGLLMLQASSPTCQRL